MKRSTTVAITACLISAVVLGAVGLVFLDRYYTPRPARLSTKATGDTRVSSALTAHAPHGAHHLSGFVMRNNETLFGGLGADRDTEFEIGSITKTFNVELLRILSDRGEVSPHMRVGEILDTDAPISDVKLEELANHTSGLPRLAGVSWWRAIWSGYAETNPYADITSTDILEAAQDQELKNRGTELYSNYGAALLGQLLAVKTGITWPELVEKEILQPLGMKDTYVATFGRVAADAPVGINQFGRPAAVWEMEGYAPAGAIRSTSADMAKYAAYLLEKGLPGYGWQEDIHGAWHNGGTAGFSTQLRINPRLHQAAYVAGDTEVLVDALPDELLSELS